MEPAWRQTEIEPACRQTGVESFFQLSTQNLMQKSFHYFFDKSLSVYIFTQCLTNILCRTSVNLCGSSQNYSGTL